MLPLSKHILQLMLEVMFWLKFLHILVVFSMDNLMAIISFSILFKVSFIEESSDGFKLNGSLNFEGFNPAFNVRITCKV